MAKKAATKKRSAAKASTRKRSSAKAAAPAGRKRAAASVAPETESVTRHISERSLKELLRYDNECKGRMDSVNGGLRQAIKEASDKRFLNTGAYAVVKRFYRMLDRDPIKGRAMLDAFDLYRDMLKLDQRARDKAADMFKDGAEDGEETENVVELGAKKPARGRSRKTTGDEGAQGDPEPHPEDANQDAGEPQGGDTEGGVGSGHESGIVAGTDEGDVRPRFMQDVGDGFPNAKPH